jgi:SAM-dependent methyltransferase
MAEPDATDPNDPYDRLSYRRLIAWPARITREAPFLREVLASAPSRRLLDLGCGTGEHARFLQEEGFEVTGVDASEAQLAEARGAGPGPEFVKGDLAELSAAVSGPFGGAISLGNGLPHLDAGQMARFLGHLAALLLPGSPVLFQLLGYDRILDARVTSLPLNVREDEGERVVFLRLMDPRPDGTVLFNPTTLRWRPGEEPPVEVVTGKNVLLKGWRRAELEAALAEAGFRVEEVFGGMRREAWDAAASPDTVVLARR